MLSYLWRFIKRVAVLIPGLIIAYFSIHDIFPYFDKRLPLGLAILATYILGAYVLIPAIVRLFRIIVPAKHLPLYCLTPDGFASDPLNIGLIGTRRQLILAMMAADWHITDMRTPKNILHSIWSTLFKLPYNGAPLSNLYLFGRKQDLGFEMQSTKQNSRGHRHHVRFWATTLDDIHRISASTIHWHKDDRESGRQLLWIGAASRDIGITFVKQNMQITHMVTPDTDSERELIVNHLTHLKLAETLAQIRLFNAYKIANRAWRGWKGYLQTDGNMTILKLRE